MTDKEKLKEIKKLADAMYYAAQYLTTDASRLHKAMDEYHQFIIHEWREEPVAPKVLEDMLNAKTAAESLGISQEEHDRIVDELIYGKEPEYLDDFLALEEIPPKFPLISQKKCMYTKDDFTDEDRKILCDGCKEECELNKEEPVSEECIYNRTLEERQRSCKFCSAACQARINEEPVSEGLDDAAFDYAESCKYDGGEKLLCVEHFKAGAKWQKQQDQETIELAEDHAMLAGMEKMKEQMMATGVVGVVHHFGKCKVASVHYNDPTGVPMVYFTPTEGLSAGDEVKIIVIKKD